MGSECDDPLRPIHPWHEVGQLRLLRFPLLFIFALSLLVRLTVRDHISGLSALYYATPPPVLAGIAFLIGLSWFERKSLKKCLSFLFVSAGTLFVWGWSNYHGDPVLSLPRNARIFFWNAARGKWGPRGMVRHAAAFNADAIGIVEAGIETKGTEGTWRRGFPEKHISVLQGDMLFITGGEAACAESGELGRGGVHTMC